MKTALAPTVGLATPRVEKFAEKLRKFFGEETKLVEFFTCDPSILDVEDRRGNKWVEGSWGCRLLVNSFETEYMYDFKRLSEVIEVSSVLVKARENKVELSIWLTARVMR